MKKALSIVLAVLMAVSCLVPAFAAEGDPTAPDSGESAVKHTVTFVQPSSEFEGGYMFVHSIDGEIQFQPDPDGEYVFFDNRYMLPSNIVHEEDVPDERFSPIQYTGDIEVAEGETVAFRVMTSEKYNVLTAAVFVNGQNAYTNAKEEYTVYVDRDLVINIAEYDENGQPALLRNHFKVKLTSGDGYKVKTLKGQNYSVVYYGDEFYFRVYVSDDYSASGMKVHVQRGKSVLNDYVGDEFDAIGNLMGANEQLTSYGIDEDGCRLYKIENITTDCKIIVSGVQEKGTEGIMAFLKRILRLILNLFGIELDILDSVTAYYTVTIDAATADGVTYEVVRSSSDELAPKEFNVTSGEGVSIIVTKKDPDQHVSVKWIPGNEFATYQTNWVLNYNTITGEVTYSAVYNIDNISADTQIVIS